MGSGDRQPALKKTASAGCLRAGQPGRGLPPNPYVEPLGQSMAQGEQQGSLCYENNKESTMRTRFQGKKNYTKSTLRPPGIGGWGGCEAPQSSRKGGTARPNESPQPHPHLRPGRSPPAPRRLGHRGRPLPARTTAHAEYSAQYLPSGRHLGSSSLACNI